MKTIKLGHKNVRLIDNMDDEMDIIKLKKFNFLKERVGEFG